MLGIDVDRMSTVSRVPVSNYGLNQHLFLVSSDFLVLVSRELLVDHCFALKDDVKTANASASAPADPIRNM